MAAPKPVWHLRRGDEQPCLLSNRELLLLAKLRYLRSTDLLWRPGLKCWKTANSIPGLLISPTSVVTIQSDLIAATVAFAKKLYEIYDLFLARWRDEFRPRVSAWNRSIQLHVLDAYRHVRGTKFDLRYTFAALLVAVASAGVLNFPQPKLFAADNQAAPPDAVPREPRHPALTPTDTDAVALTHCAAQPETAKPATVEAEATDDAQLLGLADLSGFVFAPAPLSEPQSPSVPVPTKKPAIPVKSPSAGDAARPRPMRFGVIGFNYSPQ
jgi:hypothetical protein